MDELTAVGVSDEVKACEQCGKQNLRRTVLLSDGRYLGTDCAGMVLHGKKTPTNARRAESDARAAEHHARRERAATEDARWQAFLADRGNGSDVAARIQSLGGFTAARAAYSQWRRHD